MDKEQIAIMRLKEAAQMSEQIYGQPLIVTTSGGKDSSVCLTLAERAGIKYEVMHSHTTADAPETYYFLKEEFKRLELSKNVIKVTVNKPTYQGKRTSMWDLITKKPIPPMRTARYCCQILKENSGNGRFIVTGVRWEESERRKNRGIYETIGKTSSRITLMNDNDENRRIFETCKLKSKRSCNPIIDWTDKDIWDFITSQNLKINPLYYCGQSRVGCIGCPMAGKQRISQFAKWPKYKNNYMKSFERMLLVRKNKGLKSQWENAEEVFHWWMEDGILPGQIGLFDDEED